MLTTIFLVVIALLTLISALLSFQERDVTIGFLSFGAFVLTVVVLLLGIGVHA